MCTLIVLHRCVPGRPLVVAANRDEFLNRPAEAPALRSSRAGPIVAPRDLEAGGTWVGISQRSVFAGLTNLRAAAPVNSGAGTGSSQGAPAALRSRGEVVMRALESESTADAIGLLSKLEEGLYNPFQLLVADGREACLVVYRDRPMIVELEPGPHVVGNVEDDRIAAMLASEWGESVVGAEAGGDGNAYPEKSGPEVYPGFEGVDGLVDLEEPRALKLARIRERVEKLMTEPGRDLFEGLAGICREHVEVEQGGASPFESTCVHVADRYGTRSSLLLELSDDPEANRLWTTDGPPCVQSFENRSSLLRDLGVRSRSWAGTEPM